MHMCLTLSDLRLQTTIEQPNESGFVISSPPRARRFNPSPAPPLDFERQARTKSQRHVSETKAYPMSLLFGIFLAYAFELRLKCV